MKKVSLSAIFILVAVFPTLVLLSCRESGKKDEKIEAEKVVEAERVGAEKVVEAERVEAEKVVEAERVGAEKVVEVARVEAEKAAPPATDSEPVPPRQTGVQPLRIFDLEGAQLAQTRADRRNGFVWAFMHAEFPGDGSKKFGYVFDSGNNYLDFSANENAPVYLLIYGNSKPVEVWEGDYVTVEYDGGQTRKIYPPALSGKSGKFYVGLDGSTYYDIELTDLAKAAPTPVP